MVFFTTELNLITGLIAQLGAKALVALFYFKTNTSLLYLEECSLVSYLAFITTLRPTSLAPTNFFYLSAFTFNFNFF